ncbi:hypothetical protein ACFONC_08755 [Luteimonas soli]|uniref:Uncharacterized protein n=1 Tax=Luteimonas soli TaxID=1648966 RepID=A0ABV7XL32_9GAMM
MDKAGPPVMRFVPAVWAALLHLVLFAGAFALFLGRKPGVFRWQAVIDLVPGFYTHVFNFSLSYLLLAGIGFMWVMMGVALRHVAWAALFLVVGNLAYEFLLPLLNTRDPVDAAYGVGGTLLAFAWLWIVQRAGLRPNPKAGLRG